MRAPITGDVPIGPAGSFNMRSFKLFYKKRLAYFCVARHKKIKQAYDVPST